MDIVPCIGGSSPSNVPICRSVPRYDRCASTSSDRSRESSVAARALSSARQAAPAVPDHDTCSADLGRERLEVADLRVERELSGRVTQAISGAVVHDDPEPVGQRSQNRIPRRRRRLGPGLQHDARRAGTGLDPPQHAAATAKLAAADSAGHQGTRSRVTGSSVGSGLSAITELWCRAWYPPNDFPGLASRAPAGQKGTLVARKGANGPARPGTPSRSLVLSPGKGRR